MYHNYTCRCIYDRRHPLRFIFFLLLWMGGLMERQVVNNTAVTTTTTKPPLKCMNPPPHLPYINPAPLPLSLPTPSTEDFPTHPCFVFTYNSLPSFLPSFLPFSPKKERKKETKKQKCLLLLLFWFLNARFVRNTSPRSRA